MKVFTAILCVALAATVSAAPNPGLADLVNGVGNLVTSTIDNVANMVGGSGGKIEEIAKKIEEAIKKLEEKLKEAQEKLANSSSILDKKLTEVVIAQIQKQIDMLKKMIEKLQTGQPGEQPKPEPVPSE